MRVCCEACIENPPEVIAQPSRRSRTAAPRGGGAGDGGALPGFFYRLAPRDQKVYLRSDAIDAFDLVAGPNALALAEALIAALEGGSVAGTGRAAQALVTELCRLLGVRNVPIEVKGVRPRNARGELHGIFYPDAPRIVLWTRTALRHDVVKPKTFLRTLMHELAHYLDYAAVAARQLVPYAGLLQTRIVPGARGFSARLRRRTGLTMARGGCAAGLPRVSPGGSGKGRRRLTRV